MEYRIGEVCIEVGSTSLMYQRYQVISYLVIYDIESGRWGWGVLIKYQLRVGYSWALHVVPQL